MKFIKRWYWRRLERRLAALSERVSAHGMRLDAALPSPMTTVAQAPMLAIDLEMTGLDPAVDNIISIGWVPVTDGAIELADADEVMLLSDSCKTVGDSATIHGIRDCDWSGGVATTDGLSRMLEALRGRVAVFHHAPLDVGFLDRAMRRELGFGWPYPTIDTLQWYRHRQLRMGHEAAATGTRLDTVRMHYGLSVRTAHNALDDAVSCAEVALILAARSRARLIDVCILPSP